MEQIVRVTPAWDKRDPDPRKNYGIHGVDLVFILKGDKGAVQFGLSTGWLLPETIGLSGDTHETLYNYNRMLHAAGRSADLYPMPYDLGYHSPKPMYEGQPSLDCDLVPEGRCYYDGSGLNAYNAFAVMLREGGDGLWKYLEEYYKELFDA